MEKQLLINYSNIIFELNDNNIVKYNLDLKFDSSNYSRCIVIVNSIEDLQKQETFTELKKSTMTLSLLVLSNNPTHLEEYSDKSRFESIISGIDQSDLNVRINEILNLV
ncbi:MAG: hypothetical protein ACJ0DE_01655 [Dehalococcoidia bacterium]|jgi:hypothetical protein|tara:strand:- start:310 stop:636 length:327 start_codon:yes stop_codon:yes gene_type:complete